MTVRPSSVGNNSSLQASESLAKTISFAPRMSRHVQMEASLGETLKTAATSSLVRSNVRPNAVGADGPGAGLDWTPARTAKSISLAFHGTGREIGRRE